MQIIQIYRYRAPDLAEDRPPGMKTFPGGERLVAVYRRDAGSVSLLEARHAAARPRLEERWTRLTRFRG